MLRYPATEARQNSIIDNQCTQYFLFIVEDAAQLFILSSHPLGVRYIDRITGPFREQ